jgi:hypothetical protein
MRNKMSDKEFEEFLAKLLDIKWIIKQINKIIIVYNLVV